MIFFKYILDKNQKKKLIKYEYFLQLVFKLETENCLKKFKKRELFYLNINVCFTELIKIFHIE